MNVYSVTVAFSAPQLGVHLDVLDIVGKIASRNSCLIGAAEYASQAFWDWVETTNSLNYLSFVGVLPDPAVGGTTVKSGAEAIAMGSSVVTVAGAAFGFVPTSVVATVWKPAGGANLFATVRLASVTADGFVADLSAAAPAAGYVLAYAAVP